MPPYIGVRAFNRSQSVRIGGQRVTATATSWIDLGNVQQRREFARHSAIGAVFAVQPLTGTDSDVIVEEGLEVTAQGTPDMTVDVAAGRLRNRDTGEAVDVDAVDNESITAAHATLVRIDIVQVDTDGVVSVKDGTAAATPSAPAPDDDNIVIATINVPATDTAIGQAQITDTRPR